MSTDETDVLEWPMHKRVVYAAIFGGVAYAFWLGQKFGAGWYSLIAIPMCVIFASVCWAFAGTLLVNLGQAVRARAPLWVAISAQVLALPLAVAIAVCWFGYGSEGSGRYGSP